MKFMEERTAASVHEYARFAHWQLQQLSKLSVTMHYNRLSSSSSRLFVLERPVMLMLICKLACKSELTQCACAESVHMLLVQLSA